MISEIAIGEIEDSTEATKSAAAQLVGSGGKKRSENTTPEWCGEIAPKVAEKWLSKVPLGRSGGKVAARQRNKRSGERGSPRVAE